MSKKSLRADNIEDTDVCNVECECNCNCHSPEKQGCLPIRKWKIKCISCVCLENQQENCENDCCENECEPAVVNEIPPEDVESVMEEKKLVKKNGTPFKRGKALLVGINYTGTDSELKGCINDVVNMYTYLTKVEKFDPTLIRILVDDPNSELHHLPTRKNILAGMRWLVNDNPMGDKEDPISLFMHYSGHGSWVWDRQSDEVDRKDETICPLDYHQNGLIKDDQLRKELVIPIKDASNIHLTCVFDCCHSGTILDLRYNVSVKLNVNRPDYSKINIREDKHYAKSKCRVTVFSGCMDKQYSADAYIAQSSQGAMSWSFLYLLRKFRKERRKLTYKKIITHQQALLKKKGYDQIPQLTFNRYINLKERYTV